MKIILGAFLLIALCWATTVAQQTNNHQPTNTLAMDVFGNRLEEQVWIRYSYGNFLLSLQNQRSSDGKTALVVPLAGYNFRINESNSVSAFGGRQYTYQTNAWDRTIVFINGKTKIKGIEIASINRLSFGKTFIHRHIQTVRGLLPYQIAITNEELITPQGVREAHVGVRRTWAKGSYTFSLNPNWDIALHHLDVQVNLTKRFK